jgi:error-prone DNA polymerase
MAAWRRSGRIEKHRGKLIANMEKKGIPTEFAERVFQQIRGFGDYGFPESHAASFALISYAAAYLRFHYPPEFTCALLNAQPMGFYAPGTLIEDARRHGVKVLPVDVRRSRWDATLEMRASAEAPAVRLGVRSVRGLGSKAKEILEAARAGGPFESIDDFVRRTRFDQRTLRHLAEAGAFDGFVPDEPDLRKRRAALWEVLDTLRGDAGPLAPRRRTSPGSASRAAALPRMSPGELTEADYRMTGISLNGHPMSHLRPVLVPNGIRTARQLATEGKDGEQIAGAGLVICRQRPGTAKGFVFLTLEDETGTVNVVVTPKRFERQALLISTTPLLLVRGTLQVEQGVVNIRGEEFRGLKAEVGAEFAGSHDFH